MGVGIVVQPVILLAAAERGERLRVESRLGVEGGVEELEEPLHPRLWTGGRRRGGSARLLGERDAGAGEQKGGEREKEASPARSFAMLESRFLAPRLAASSFRFLRQPARVPGRLRAEALDQEIDQGADPGGGGAARRHDRVERAFLERIIAQQQLDLARLDRRARR